MKSYNLDSLWVINQVVAVNILNGIQAQGAFFLHEINGFLPVTSSTKDYSSTMTTFPVSCSQ
jgi:hypothetical protein